MSTPRAVLNGAYAKSSKNPGGQHIADEQVELLGVVYAALRGLFAFGARLNPEHFSVRETVSSQTEFGETFWAIPATAEAVYKVEVLRDTDADGNVDTVLRCVRVPAEEPDAEPGKPAYIRVGRRYYPAGNADDPASGEELRLWYSKIPEAPATIDTEFDELWSDTWDELLEYEVAIYLAIKDERESELPALRAERDRWALLFAAHIEHADPAMLTRFPNRRRPDTHIVPLGSLLAGGTDLKL